MSQSRDVFWTPKGSLSQQEIDYDDYRFEIQSSESSYHSVFRPPGKFKRNFEYTGPVSIYVWHRGYAPVTLKSVEITDTLLAEGVDITLPDGFSYTVEIESPDGTPVPDAKITYSLDGESSRFAHSRTGSSGAAILENLAGSTLDLRIDAPGFAQTTVRDISLTAGGSHKVSLNPAVPTTLSFISAESGKPVPDVQLSVKSVKAQGHSRSGGKYFTALSGENGVATLEGLPEKSHSWIDATADGFQNRVLPDVSPGDTRTIILQTEPIAELKITIPESVMAQYKGKTLTAKIAHWTNYGGFTTDVWNTEIPIPIESPIFTTPLPLAWERDWENCISFRIQYPEAVANESMELPLPDDKGTISVTLPEYAGSLKDSKRDVIYRLDLPKDSQEAPILDLEFTDARRAIIPRRIPFVDGEAQFSIRAPAESRKSAILGLKHYTFDSQKLDVDIPAGDTPFIVDLGKAIPTGTLVVDLVLPEEIELSERPISQFLSLLRPRNSGKRYLDDDVDFLKNDTSSRSYLINRVPLGSKYFVIFRQNNILMQSQHIKLSKKKPILPVELSSKDISDFKINFPQGIPQDLDPSEIEICYSDHKSGLTSYGSWLNFSHRILEGKSIIFPNINWSLPGKYFLSFRSQRDLTFFFNPINKKITDAHRWFLPGKVIEGVLIDKATGKPIPGVRMGTRNYDEYGYAHFAETPTDDQGRFRYSNLTDKPAVLSPFNNSDYRIILEKPDMSYETGTGKPIKLSARIEKR